MRTITRTKWIQYERQIDNPSMRVFCFPMQAEVHYFMQDGTNILMSQLKYFPSELPGRESRIDEQPLRVMSVAIDAIVEEIEPYLTENMAFVGHSMGKYAGLRSSQSIVFQKSSYSETCISLWSCTT